MQENVVKMGEKTSAVEAERLRLVAEFEDLFAANPGYNWSTIQKDFGANGSAINQWKNGVYAASCEHMNERARQFLARRAISEEISPETRLVKTRIHCEMTNALKMAQAIKGIAVVALTSGNGKTMTVKHFCTKSKQARILMGDCSWFKPLGAMKNFISGMTGTMPTGRLPSLIHEAEEILRKRTAFPIINDAHLLGFHAVDLLCKISETTDNGFALSGHESMVATYATSARRDSEHWTRVQTRIFWCQPDFTRDADGNYILTNGLPSYFTRDEIHDIAVQYLPALTNDGLDALCNPVLCECLRAVVKAAQLARQIQISSRVRMADAKIVKAAIAMRTPRLTTPRGR